MPAYEHPDLVALDEIENVLEAYAEARLSPSGPVLARMRRTVLSEAAAVGATRAAAARVASPEAAAERLRFLWRPRLRVPALGVASVTAAAMGLALGTAVLAAPAGSPFYGARVALEQAFLPTQIDARLASHEEHLDERIAEAEAAAAAGDIVALQAALAAYQAEVDQAVTEAGDDNDRLARLEAVLQKHVDKLTALADRLPTQAARDNALEHAIQAGERAVDKLNKRQEHGNNGGTNNGGTNNGGTNNGGTNNGGTNNGGKPTDPAGN